MNTTKIVKIFTGIIACFTTIFFILGEIAYNYTYTQINYNLATSVPSNLDDASAYPTLGGLFDYSYQLFLYLGIFLIICSVASIIVSMKYEHKVPLLMVVCMCLPLIYLGIDWLYIRIITGSWMELGEFFRSVVCEICRTGGRL